LGVYLLLATLAAPPLVELGLAPIQAHLFVLYFGMLSMITPPVALAAFAAASLADAPQMRTGFEAMRLGWCAYLVPFLFIYHPAILLQGPILDIAFTLACVLAALLLTSGAIAGYGLGPIRSLTRWLLILLVVPLLLPLPDTLVGLRWVALVLAVALLAAHVYQARRSPNRMHKQPNTDSIDA